MCIYDKYVWQLNKDLSLYFITLRFSYKCLSARLSIFDDGILEKGEGVTKTNVRNDSYSWNVILSRVCKFVNKAKNKLKNMKFDERHH